MSFVFRGKILDGFIGEIDPFFHVRNSVVLERMMSLF